MNVNQPFFSIIIATYNRADLLQRALHSLVAQTEEDWEALVIDDGSTDDTYMKILPFLSKYNKIKYQKTANRGEALSKNEGLFASKGKFISFLDSDDEYRPHHLQSRKELLLKNPNVNFLYGGLEIIGNHYVPDRFDRSRKIHLNDCKIGGTFFIERNILLSLNGLHNIPLGADADLFDRAKAAQIELMHTDIPTYIYHRELTDSITNNV